MKIKNRR